MMICFGRLFIYLFIYQTVSDSNKFSPLLSTDRILKKLKRDCRKVNILNLYYRGYFPQIDENKNLPLKGLITIGLFPFRDKYIDEFFKQGMNEDEIIKRIRKADFINSDEIDENAKASMKELENREKNVDVKIVDYIKEHIREEQLFYSCNHPNENLLTEYVNRIMEYLGYARIEINSQDVVLSVGSLKAWDVPIYPSVLNFFDLKKYENRYYVNKGLYEDMLLSFEEYMKVYIQMLQKEDVFIT